MGVEEYSAMADQWMRHADFILMCQSYLNEDTRELETLLSRLRLVKDIDEKDPLPAFVVVRASSAAQRTD